MQQEDFVEDFNPMDGSDGGRSSTGKKTGLIAFQSEEHGLGIKAAENATKKYFNDSARRSPRATSNDTVSALIGKHADSAVVPIENDIGGYNKKTLMSLMDFRGYEICGEVGGADEYVLAVPYAQVMEMAESAFTSSFDGKLSVGNLPRDMQAQESLRRRIGRVYASADAQNRCQSALDGMRAEGMKVESIPNGGDPYRFVMQAAMDSLDADRLIETRHDDFTNQNVRVSRLRGVNYTKSLSAVLLPRDQASLGLPKSGAVGDDNRPRVSFGESDYIIIDDRLEGDQTIQTRFLALQRGGGQKISPLRLIAYTLFGWTPYWRPEVAEYTKRSGPLHSAFDNRKSDKETVRVLLKVNSRGRGVTDTSALARRLASAQLNYTPITIDDRPETLPMVYEIELKTPKQIGRFGDVLEFAARGHHNWKPQMLGAYPSSTPLPSAATHVHNPYIRPIYLALGTGLFIALTIILFQTLLGG
ncbi:MAG: prephenate dehydratase domain-containing protein [Parvularculaceae bacterium]